MTALEALLSGLIDYAGLFPPVSLDMLTAVRNYSEYRSGERAWMLGRFIVPVQRLNEFADAFAEACCKEQASPWLLSLLSSGNATDDVRLIESFSEGAAFLDAIEFKATDAAQAKQQLQSVPSGMAAYVEFLSPHGSQILPALKTASARAKIRTGGTTADAIPSVEELASFLIACAKTEVSFKATAGLHHPLRATRKLTCQEDSVSAIMHGFINVFVAAAVAYQGASQDDVINVLHEQSPVTFEWQKNALRWRDHRLTTKQIKSVREKFAISFGSCSFTEPIQDLKALGWL